MNIDDLPFKVVAVADCGDELLGSVADPLLAHVLLGAAAAMYPRRKIELRLGARIIEPRTSDVGFYAPKAAN
jgi:hypothetical protein